MKPTNREEFKGYCLRKLGHPVIQINVSDEQIDDRIDEALNLYKDYHFDGSEKIYYKHLITEQNKTDGFIVLPENIIGAVRIFPYGNANSGSNTLFSIEYQIAVNDLYTLMANTMAPYVMMRQQLALINEVLVGEKPVRYSRHKNRFYIDMNWDRVVAGEYFIIEAYEVIDPEVYTDVWSDRWLQNYATALIKQNWGSNLTKMTGIALPGGVTFNGERILDDANREIEKLEDELKVSWVLGPVDMVG